MSISEYNPYLYLYMRIIYFCGTREARLVFSIWMELVVCFLVLRDGKNITIKF